MSFSKIASIILTSALCVTCLILPGCGNSSSTGLSGGSSSGSEDSTPTSSEYMSNMNNKADELSTRLSSFVDAVSREDLVSMKLQADSAFDVLEQMKSLEAPSELDDVKASYDEGVSKLEDALNEYIDLYSELDENNSDDAFNLDNYNEKLSSVQQLYNEGVESIKKADELATEKN